MISNLNGSGLFGFTEKKQFLPVRGSGSDSIRLPGYNNEIQELFENDCVVISAVYNFYTRIVFKCAYVEKGTTGLLSTCWQPMITT